MVFPAVSEIYLVICFLGVFLLEVKLLLAKFLRTLGLLQKSSMLSLFSCFFFEGLWRYSNVCKTGVQCSVALLYIFQSFMLSKTKYVLFLWICNQEIINMAVKNRL
jgi:hypothetical protein